MRKMVLSRTFVVVGFIIMVAFLLTSIPMHNLANFNNHLDTFSAHIKNNDKDSAEKSFERLKTDYNYLIDMKLRYLADNFWFADTFLYEAMIAYLAEDFDKVEKLLAGHEDDYRASYLAGLYKYRLFQTAYQKAKTNSEKSEIQERATERILPDFEKCVKEGPGIDKNFNCSFDYDLISSPESFKKALENPRSGPKFVLGVPKDGLPSKKVGPKGPLNRRPGEFGAGSRDPKKGG